MSIEARTNALDLIERVASLDLEAGQYLLSLYDQVPRNSDRVSIGAVNYRCASSIDPTFMWDSTPQGRQYWADLNQRDGELRGL